MPMQITVIDRAVPLSTSQREITPEGFIRVPGVASRTGIYEYYAFELAELDGVDADIDPNRIIRVMRTPEEVFSPETLDSYVGADVTLGHPSQGVDSENYRILTAGTVLGATREGDVTRVDMLIKSQDAINALAGGLTSLSPGYSAIYVPADPADPFDYYQAQIRINHLALVPAGRGGESMKVADIGGRAMPKLVTLPGGQQVEVADDATALLINSALHSEQQRASAAEQRVNDMQAQTARAEQEAEAARQAEQQQATVDAAVADTLSALDAARKLAGADFAPTAMTKDAICREALAKAQPGVALDGLTAEQLEGVFQYAVSAAVPAPSADAASATGLAADAAAASTPQPTARQAHLARAADAWKPVQERT